MKVEVGPGYGPAVRVFAAECSSIELPGAIRVGPDDSELEQDANCLAVGEELFALLESLIEISEVHSIYLAQEYGILCFAVWKAGGGAWESSELEEEIRENISSALEGLNAANGP